MSEQLLSAEGEARNITSLQSFIFVFHCPEGTNYNNKIRGSDDTKVQKQHKDCLQACHKGMVGSEVFSASRDKIFSIFVIPYSLLCCRACSSNAGLTFTVLPSTENCGFHLRSRSSRLLNHWPRILLVCCLTLSILTLPPRSSSSSSFRRWARVIYWSGHQVPRCYSA